MFQFLCGGFTPPSSFGVRGLVSRPRGRGLECRVRVWGGGGVDGEITRLLARSAKSVKLGGSELLAISYVPEGSKNSVLTRWDPKPYKP